MKNTKAVLPTLIAALTLTTIVATTFHQEVYAFKIGIFGKIVSTLAHLPHKAAQGAANFGSVISSINFGHTHKNPLPPPPPPPPPIG